MGFKQGDRVLIVDENHHGYGLSGTIDVPPFASERLNENWLGCFRQTESGLLYYVELDRPRKDNKGNEVTYFVISVDSIVKE